MRKQWEVRALINIRSNSMRAGLAKVVTAVAACTATVLLASCGGGSSSSGGSVIPPPPATLSISTSTSFYPTFDPNTSDYVVATPNGAPLAVSVNAPVGTFVAVDGQLARTASFTSRLNISPGQRFSFVVRSGSTLATYNVRCLPSDFPAWTTERPGTPENEFYAFEPDISVSGAAAKNYFILADNYGVPIWWYRSATEPFNALFLPNGDIAWTVFANGVEEHKLNGTLVKTTPVASPNGEVPNTHELQRLANGDYIIICDLARGPVDMSAYGGYTTDAVIDNVIEEVTPTGALVWRWSAMDHIPFSETDSAWLAQFVAGTHPTDPYHMNSVEPDGTGFVVSLRHLDAVIRIDKATGNIVWKLGGVHTAASLSFSNDHYGSFGGQHDARILSDGTLTVHDNGTGLGRAPRGVRYQIDTVAKTATLVEQVVDPDVTSSGCCGNARKTTTGNWVAAWGMNPVVTELTPTATRVFRMTFKDPYFTYRAEPVPAGVLSRAALRAGMDAQYPR